MQTFKIRLGRALSNLIKLSLLTTKGDWTRKPANFPSKPNHDSMTQFGHAGLPVEGQVEIIQLLTGPL